MFNGKNGLKGALGSLCILSLVACAGSNKTTTPAPLPLKATVTTSLDLNPDMEGRPSPVVLTIYQLQEDAAFKNADFFSLSDQAAKTLGPDLIAREELELRPGQSREFDARLDPKTRYIGVTAGFREIQRAQWRALAQVPEAKKSWLFFTSKKPVELKIALESLAVTLTVERR